MKKYVRLFLAVIAIALAVIFLVSLGATGITVSLNNKYLQLYRENVTGVSSPWYDNGFHIVDGRFISEMDKMKESGRNVISVGSSVSVIPFHQELTEGKKSHYRFMTCGNGSYQSDRILISLLDVEDLIDDDDIIKLEVSFSTYRNPGITITESMLDKWGKYSVEPDFSVRKNSPLLTPIYWLNTRLIRIQSLWELGFDAWDQVKSGSHGLGLTDRAAEFGMVQNGEYDDVIIPGNFRNNYYNYEAVEETLCTTEQFDQAEEALETLISDISGKHSVVIELSPFPPNLEGTTFGANYTETVNERLIPYLDSNSIRYLDYRDDYSQDEYADGVHLGYEAGVNYTRKIMEDLDEY